MRAPSLRPSALPAVRSLVLRLAWLLAALFTGLFLPAAAADRPTIVYIVADDLGWKDVGFHGSDIRTPNIDQLAKSGAQLNQFYAQSMCTPTRAALMTASSDGVIPFDLLALDRFDEVMGRLGAGLGRSAPVGPLLSESARAARKPPPPAERVGALHDTVHREVGQSRLARTIKVDRTP